MKRPKVSARERIREARAQTQQAQILHSAIHRMLMAVLTEAEGEITISREVYENPGYEGARTVFSEKDVTLKGYKKKSV